MKGIKSYVFAVLMVACVSVLFLSVFCADRVNAAETQYEAYTDIDAESGYHRYFMRELNSGAEGDVVYCYNMNSWAPLDVLEAEDKEEFLNPQPYVKHILGKENAQSLVSDGARISDPEELYKTVLNVMLLGYPNNISGFWDGSAPVKYREATQLALWYYTDSYDYNANREFVNANKEACALADQIVEGAKTYEYTGDKQLNIYEYKGKQVGGRPFQNFLSAKFVPKEEPMIEEKPEPEISKKEVEVDKVCMGEDNQTMIEVVGAEIQIFEGENTAGKKVDEWVTKAGETHLIKELEAGKKYTFHEASAPDGLKVVTDFVFSVDENGQVTVHSLLTSGKAAYSDGKLVVTDEREIPVKRPDETKNPTGPDEKKGPAEKKSNMPDTIPDTIHKRDTERLKSAPKTGDKSPAGILFVMLMSAGILSVSVVIKKAEN